MPDLPQPGQLVANDDGTRVQCHVCGRWFAVLGVHVARAHGMLGDEYREEFGLNRGTKLASPAMRARYAVLFGERITKSQPPVNPLLNAPPERIAVGRQRPKRLQARRNLSEQQERFQAEHPNPKTPRFPRIRAQHPELEAGPRRLAELHRDPEWRAKWLLRGRRASVLTDEQILFVRGQSGRETRRALAGRLGVSVDVISKVWRGDLRPLSELLATVNADGP